MNSLIRNIFLISLIFLSIILSSANFCLANEDLEVKLGNDYLIATDKTIKTTIVTDEKIITLEPFFTIFNEKNVILLHPQKVGKTTFTIFLDTSDVTFNITVRPSTSTLNTRTIHKNIFEIMLLDSPPDLEGEPDLDAPPQEIKEIKKPEKSGDGRGK